MTDAQRLAAEYNIDIALCDPNQRDRGEDDYDDYDDVLAEARSLGFIGDTSISPGDRSALAQWIDRTRRQDKLTR